MAHSRDNHALSHTLDTSDTTPPMEPPSPLLSHEDEERRVLHRVIESFRKYFDHASMIMTKKRSHFESLPDHHRRLISGTYLKKWNDGMECIRKNAHFIANFVPENEDTGYINVTDGDMEKVRSTLRQFVRDWSEEGMKERRGTHYLIYDKLLDAFRHVPFEERGGIHVLVPGAGLARLAYDIARLGFSCQGNEFSFHMLLASNFILNKTSQSKQYTIYPFVHSFSNHMSVADQLRPIPIPDVLPGGLPANVNFSMVAGDFLEVYADQPGSWDAVVTCFFLDTAHNVVAYIERIYDILKPGAVWINLGPLLYHFEGISESIELTVEEVINVVKFFGFEVFMYDPVESTYTANSRSMMSYQYTCSFFTARKPYDK